MFLPFPSWMSRPFSIIFLSSRPHDGWPIPSSISISFLVINPRCFVRAITFSSGVPSLDLSAFALRVQAWHSGWGE